VGRVWQSVCICNTSYCKTCIIAGMQVKNKLYERYTLCVYSGIASTYVNTSSFQKLFYDFNIGIWENQKRLTVIFKEPVFKNICEYLRNYEVNNYKNH
jgi:hypothetical protein